MKIATRISGGVKIDGDILPPAALISTRRPQRWIAERKDAVRLLQNCQSTDVASTHMIPNCQRTKSGLGNTLHLSTHQFRVIKRKQTLIRRFDVHIMSGIVPIRVIARRSRRHRRSDPLASYPIEIIALRDILPAARRQITNATLKITVAHANARRIRRRRRRRRARRTADEFDVVESDIAGETRPSDRIKANRIRRGTDKRNGALDPSIALGALSRPNLRRFAARFEIDAQRTDRRAEHVIPEGERAARIGRIEKRQSHLSFVAQRRRKRRLDINVRSQRSSLRVIDARTRVETWGAGGIDEKIEFVAADASPLAQILVLEIAIESVRRCRRRTGRSRRRRRRRGRA